MLDASETHYREQQKIRLATAQDAARIFRRMDDDFDASWRSIGPELTATVQAGMLTAAETSVGHVAEVLAETNQVAAATSDVVPSAFARSAPDGRSLESLLHESVVRAKTAVGVGETIGGALELGRRFITTATLTAVSDAGRGVVAADIASRPKLTGYTRMLNPPSCSRCVILAGKWFRWNEGFLRHPRCDCRHIPASEDIAGDLRTDPYEYFRSLTPAQQDKAFGRSEARAVREGADIFRVVNIKGRGLATAKGNLRYGTPSRVTVDDIFRTAGTRTNAIRMLEQEGYITGPQTQTGNILGSREGFGQLGKGGRARAASDAVTAARATGVRDPLNRYTMTAAERRLYDAKTKLDEARRTGLTPGSIGANSADRNTRRAPISATQLAALERQYQREISKLRTAPESVRRLARALGI